jgi:nicotinate-nucleotide adenylyltransferase
MSQRIGLYGGTFDPVHLGHLIGAQDALEQLHLDELVFIPCAQSPHKLDKESAPAIHRLRMLRAAVRGNDRFWVSDCEIKRGTPSYSIDTVRTFRRGRPRATFFWLIGMDQLDKLTSWERFNDLRQEVTFLVMDRPGPRPVRPPRGVIYLPQPRLVAISSTEIRLRVKNQLMIQHLVPSVVARYIDRTDLYR